jgi:nucleoside-diphosphate-sugar epimerase
MAEYMDERSAQFTEHIILTGASGYIGSEVVRRAISRGYKVTALTAKLHLFNDANYREIHWSLGVDLTKEALLYNLPNNWPAPTSIIHLAHDWLDREIGFGNINYIGTSKLIDLSREINLKRFVFASSVSSRLEALNAYGKIKYLCEQLITHPIGLVARIGLVYGGSEGSQWGGICKLLSGHFNFIPMVDPGTQVQPIHVMETADALLCLTSLVNPSKSMYCVAANQSMSFGSFLKLIARIKLQKKIALIYGCKKVLSVVHLVIKKVMVYLQEYIGTATNILALFQILKLLIV